MVAQDNWTHFRHLGDARDSADKDLVQARSENEHSGLSFIIEFLKRRGTEIAEKAESSSLSCDINSTNCNSQFDHAVFLGKSHVSQVGACLLYTSDAADE